MFGRYENVSDFDLDRGGVPVPEAGNEASQAGAETVEVENCEYFIGTDINFN